MVGSEPITPPTSATSSPLPAPAGATAYWDRIAECVALAKTAPTNQLRARHFAAAHRYLQLAEAQASSAAKPVPK
jgi:hypothetical protein